MNLYPVYARAHFAPLPWKRVAVEGDKIRCLELQLLSEDTWSSFPLDHNPRFWREVRQLSFYFDDNNWDKIVRFYETYGALLNTLELDEIVEHVSDVKRGLRWFRELTALLEWVKNQREGPLWEKFGPPRQSQNLADVMVTLHGSPFEFYWIAYVPRLPRRTKGGQYIFETPRTKNELFLATWLAVTDAASSYLRKRIRVTHAASAFLEGTAAIQFHALCALDAAFLQWYLQEVACYAVSRCAAKDCNNPVVPPRRVYCSERCRQREKKRRQRSEK